MRKIIQIIKVLMAFYKQTVHICEFMFIRKYVEGKYTFLNIIKQKMNVNICAWYSERNEKYN